MAAPEAPPEGPSRGGGLLDKLTGRVTALVLVVLAIGVLVAFLNSGEEDEGPRSRSVPVAERVSVPTPLAPAQITGHNHFNQAALVFRAADSATTKSSTGRRRNAIESTSGH